MAFAQQASRKCEVISMGRRDWLLPAATVAKPSSCPDKTLTGARLCTLRPPFLMARRRAAAAFSVYPRCCLVKPVPREGATMGEQIGQRLGKFVGLDQPMHSASTRSSFAAATNR